MISFFEFFFKHRIEQALLLDAMCFTFDIPVKAIADSTRYFESMAEAQEFVLGYDIFFFEKGCQTLLRSFLSESKKDIYKIVYAYKFSLYLSVEVIVGNYTARTEGLMIKPDGTLHEIEPLRYIDPEYEEGVFDIRPAATHDWIVTDFIKAYPEDASLEEIQTAIAALGLN